MILKHMPGAMKSPQPCTWEPLATFMHATAKLKNARFLFYEHRNSEGFIEKRNRDVELAQEPCHDASPPVPAGECSGLLDLADQSCRSRKRKTIVRSQRGGLRLHPLAKLEAVLVALRPCNLAFCWRRPSLLSPPQIQTNQPFHHPPVV